MLDLIAKQYKLSEEIELLISDFIIGSTEYYKNLQFKINKNILNLKNINIFISTERDHNLFKKYINKLKYYFIDIDLIICKIKIMDHFILCDIEINNNNAKKLYSEIKKNILIINPEFNMKSMMSKTNNNNYEIILILQFDKNINNYE